VFVGEAEAEDEVGRAVGEPVCGCRCDGDAAGPHPLGHLLGVSVGQWLNRGVKSGVASVECADGPIVDELVEQSDDVFSTRAVHAVAPAQVTLVRPSADEGCKRGLGEVRRLSVDVIHTYRPTSAA
jgi:hypothetical protein